MCIDADDISKSAYVDNVFLEIRTRAIRRAVLYPEGLFAHEVVLDFGRDLRDDALMAVHLDGEQKNETPGNANVIDA
jgi:hypothetical protein